MDQDQALHLARRSMYWGSWTWIFNIAGCLLGSNAFAAPLVAISTIATLGTGFVAMAWGLRARQATDDPEARRLAFWGYAFGISHLIIVTLVVIVFLIVWEVGLLEEAIFAQ